MLDRPPIHAAASPSTPDFRSFLSNCLRNPWRTGAVAPSSRALAKAMARRVLAYGTGTIVELGPGTGAITAALLDLGIPRKRLYLVEQSPEFASLLRTRFPGIRIVEGDALEFPDHAKRDGVEDVGAIVSGLPLRLISHEACAAILSRSFGMMGNTGAFVQFTYNHRPPVQPSLIASLGLVARNVGYVWLNFPPATVWEFRRAALSR